MTSAIILFPQNRLAEAMPNTSRAMMDRCVAAAEANLQSLSGMCRAHVEHQLLQMEARLARWPAAADETLLGDLYLAALSIVSSAPVAGMPDAGHAAYSLCELIDGMRMAGIWSKDPVSVHVLAMRMLLEPGRNPVEVKAILDGLSQVRSKFSAAQT